MRAIHASAVGVAAARTAIGVAVGCLLAGVVLWGGVHEAEAQEAPTVYMNARIIPVDGPEIERGYLTVHEGKIIAIGSGEVPFRGRAQQREIDCDGKVIMPGLVDTHSHVGGTAGADGSGPIQPGVRVRDSLNVRSSGFKRALAGGLTTINLMPGSGHLSSGQTVYVKLRYRKGEPSDGVRTIDDITITNPDGSPMGGLKMANGTNPQREGGASGFPETRGRAAFLVREQFLKAQAYQKKLDSARRDDGTVDDSKVPERDLDMETLCEVLRGERVVHHHTHRHDDIITVLRLAEEFGFRVVLHHVSDGWVVADEIAKAGAGVSAILVDAPGGKHEAVGLRLEAAAMMEKAGVLTALHTDDWITDSRMFLRMAALAVRGGMTRQGALESVTLSGAKLLDLEDRVGSLTVGKDADFLILSGDPFSAYTVVEKTYVEGRLAFDRADEKDRLYGLGGYGAVHDASPYFCCYDHLMQEGGK